jgi:hypothetical protein
VVAGDRPTVCGGRTLAGRFPGAERLRQNPGRAFPTAGFDRDVLCGCAPGVATDGGLRRQWCLPPMSALRPEGRICDQAIAPFATVPDRTDPMTPPPGIRRPLVLCGLFLACALAALGTRADPHDGKNDGDHDDGRGREERTDVVTYHYDNGRTGWNPHEAILSPKTVSPTKFGLLKTVPLDDQVDAEPLLVRDVEIDHRRHDVVYVVTESDTVYAIDAESGAVLKKASLGTPVPRPLNCENNGNQVGINGTPTIDLHEHALYLVTYVMSASQPIHELHALDLSTLKDKAHSPVKVAASNTLSDGSAYAFDASVQRQRPGLLNANGHVYAGFGSFCDFKAAQSRGWVLGWEQSDLKPLTHAELLNKAVAPSSTFDCYFHAPWTGNHPCYLSSVWMSGFGLAADESGKLYFTTGNTTPGIYDSSSNLAESVVKLSEKLDKVEDFFTPADESGLDGSDNDFGSGGALALPEQPGPMPHLLVAAGKEGNLFIVNRDTGKMGGFHSPDKSLSVPIDSCWCGPSYFKGSDGIGRVVSSGGSHVRVWKIDTAAAPALAQEASVAVDSGQDPGFFTSVSSKGKDHDTAIVWAVGRATGSDDHLTLYAFDAKASGGTLTQLWKGEGGTWPNTEGNANVVPTVANGRVYVGSYKQLRIFGLIDHDHPHELTEERIAHPPAKKFAFLPESGPLYWGTIRAIDGSRVELELRTGNRLMVDVSKVLPQASSDLGAVGRSLAVAGAIGPDKVFSASGIWRVKGPQQWGPDREH